MAIVDVTVIPIGTKTPSVSSYVAEIQKVLKQFEEKGEIRYQLTPIVQSLKGNYLNYLKLFKQFMKFHSCMGLRE